MTRCVQCGQVIGEDQKSMRITEVDAYDDGRRVLWGDMHERCFLRSVRSPKAALRELQLIEEESNGE